MDTKKEVKLKCLFCFSTDFNIPEEFEPQSGDMIICSNCGKKNDYDSLVRVATKEAEEWAKSEAEKHIIKALKKMGFKK